MQLGLVVAGVLNCFELKHCPQIQICERSHTRTLDLQAANQLM